MSIPLQSHIESCVVSVCYRPEQDRDNSKIVRAGKYEEDLDSWRIHLKIENIDGKRFYIQGLWNPTTARWDIELVNTYTLFLMTVHEYRLVENFGILIQQAARIMRLMENNQHDWPRSEQTKDV